jgi:hypothetical protein
MYDFIGWYGIFHDGSKDFGKRTKLYQGIFRVIKFVLDFPVTIFLFWNDWSVIIPFYMLKQFGWCDATYILFWKILNPKKNYTQEGLWWLYWTPLGLLRCKVYYNFSLILPSDPNKYFILFNGKLVIFKGEMSLKEFIAQLGVGLALVYPLTLFFNWIIYLKT